MAIGDGRSLLPVHLEEDELVAYLDGELAAPALEAARAHLLSCWDCRVRLEAFQQAIARFMQGRQAVLPEGFPPAAPPAESLRARLARENAAGEGAPGLGHVLLRWARALARGEGPPRGPVPPPPVPALSGMRHRWVALAVVAAILLVEADRPPSVSAAALLRASRLTESEPLLPGHVLHRVLLIEEDVETGVPGHRRVEVWRGAGASLGGLIEVRRAYDERDTLVAGRWVDARRQATIYRRGQGPETGPLHPATLDLESVWQLEPSAGRFLEMVGDPDLATVEERAAHYVVGFRGGAVGRHPRLLAATLTLDKTDLRAVEETLVIGGPAGRREYRVREASLRRLAASDLGRSVTQPDAILLPAAPSPRRPPAAPRPPAALSAADLAALEVDAYRRLHEAGALLGAQVSVSRVPGGRLEIDALAESEAARARLSAALAPLRSTPGVRVRVESVEEALRRHGGKGADTVVVREVEVGRDEIPVYLALHKHFSRGEGTATVSEDAVEEQIRRFSDRTLDGSREALLHALALRRLAERFPPATLQALPAQARAQWRSLVRDYARGFRERTEAVRLDLSPVFFPESRPPEPEREGGERPAPDLARAIETLCREALANDETIRSAFALSTSSSRATVVARESFWRGLLRAEALAASIEGER